MLPFPHLISRTLTRWCLLGCVFDPFNEMERPGGDGDHFFLSEPDLFEIPERRKF